MVQLKNGNLLIKEHLSNSTMPAYTDDSTIHIASGCKWPAMTVIMKLVEQGKLSLTDTISKFYTNNEFSQQQSQITLLQLMTHTHGYGYFDDWVATLDINLQDSALGIAQGGQLNGKYVPKEDLKNPPGTTVLYGDIGMQIAGAIAEKVTGKGFNQLFLDLLGNPMGMVNAKFTAFDGEIGDNVAIADGFYVRMIDYANFMLMLMNGGVFKGQKILEKSSVDAILQDYTGNLKVDPSNSNYATNGKLSFGLGNWILNDGTRHSSNGIHKFYNYFDTQYNYLAIFYLRTKLDTQDKTDDLFDKLSLQIDKIVNSTSSFSQPTVTIKSTSFSQIIKLQILILTYIIFM
ncbi:beta-lactamase (macronuclear) [Tetrahymena thermophila SB210]|uniref:Beta-lactamase n=1 Tax=Tetrahymena thermophila (strain SB210) TaxID=312017 RepID=Q239S9_TETTS|nr:beta-lactamase [Tetrahymena thermophila SB210]EAR93329.2 beta-lactamase [Tetrahymena thermophila SB210]|eukprot:XP_001013574.2 beta-lactamase [Tetrahymena thermophila SB210]